VTDRETSDEEKLATGWETDAPFDDTIVRQFLLNQASWAQMAAGSLGGETLQRDSFIAADARRPATFINCATLLQPLSAGDAEETLSAIEKFYRFESATRGMVLLLSAWPTPDLRERGWRLMGHPPLHLRPATGQLPTDLGRVTFRRVETAAQLAEWERTGIEAYPLPEMKPARPSSFLGQSALGDHRLQAWTAYLEGQPVGISAAFADKGINNVMVVATKPEARGRGIGGALTWRATLADPSLPAMLLSSDEGRPVYQKMGYIPLIRMTFWYRLRPGR
jgi:GNAT superfamily N-acetyltransferase